LGGFVFGGTEIKFVPDGDPKEKGAEAPFIICSDKA